jgi:hypothetical protein
MKWGLPVTYLGVSLHFVSQDRARPALPDSTQHRPQSNARECLDHANQRRIRVVGPRALLGRRVTCMAEA